MQRVTMSNSTEITPGAAMMLGPELSMRLELVLNPDAGGADGEPFVVLSDDPDGARVYLGRLMAGEQTLVRMVVVKTQSRPGTPSGLEGRRLDHQQRRQRWQREWEHHCAMSEAGFGATPLLFTHRGEARRGEPARSLALPPLLYDPSRGRLLRARDRTGAVLEVCRDDAILADHGLPCYGPGPVFLWNPESRQRETGPVFYQLPSEAPLQAGAEPFDRVLEEMDELIRDPMAAIRPDRIEDVRRLAEIEMDLGGATNASSQGPEAARPSGVLRPWRLEDSHGLVMELSALHFDEFCDLLGGIDEPTFRERHLGPATAVGTQMRLQQARLDRMFGRRLLFEHDTTGQDALEVFRLKCALLSQLCAVMVEYHRRCGGPHLRLSPHHVMINPTPGGGGLPGLWQFETRLISLGSPTLELPGHRIEQEIYVPPVSDDPLYQSELLRNSGFGIMQQGEFLLSGLEKQGEGEFLLKAQLHHEGLGLRWLSPKDRVLVMLGRHLVGEAEIELLARRDPEHPHAQRMIQLISEPLHLDSRREAALLKLRGIRVPHARFCLLPMLHVPCDLYSLGMLLFRALLVNDGQSIGQVALALEELRQDLASLAEIECAEDGAAEFWEDLLRGHRRPEIAGVFDVRQIWYHGHQRTEERPNAIPTELWSQAMALGLQLTSHFAGLSFCADHGDFDPSHRAGKTEAVARQFEHLLHRIDAALFGRAARNAEIRLALEQVMRETTPL